MKIKPSSKSFLSLESFAMTDIVMNLFIFFFISFSLLYTFNPHKESKIEVKLPEGKASEGAGAEGPLVVSVTQGNEIYIGKTRVLSTALKKELQLRAKLAKSAGVLVRADKLASVDTLVKVLDASKQAGIQKLGVAIEQN
ncbi:MAG: hypothetical protein A3C47_01975 [Omnitrophica bacterium RIFCSPHIGHO2_02_FULL_51_18]|nr:MAG: hypothetical protein A3C47_01975 [Omnitrophica bacterium RIFCSPHIGHO2_02_FULL_51_18]